MTGKNHWMLALGVEDITDAPPPPDMQAARETFPEAPEGVFKRPHGQVGLLIGMTERHLHSSGGVDRQGMRLSHTPLGCGAILTGVAARTPLMASSLSMEVRALQLGNPSRPQGAMAFHLSAREAPRLDFQEAEELGCRPAPLCSSCKGCSACSFRQRSFTKEEQEVLDRVNREMIVVENKVYGRYPWKPCASRMRDNYEQAEKVQANIEKKLIREGKLEAYNREVKQMIEAGITPPLSKESRLNWQGPVNYNSIFPVYNESSESTKVRVVFNLRRNSKPVA
jgi:hypothetical protein